LRSLHSLGFKIDKLTNSIENIVTGDSFPTIVLKTSRKDISLCSKKNGWRFNWNAEIQRNRQLYKLTIANNPLVIQGLISLTINSDHIFINLLESAPFNIGRKKMYLGVPGNLVAFACKTSFEAGNEGFVSFRAKTVLVDHYKKTLGAIHIGNNVMIIDTDASKTLVDKYFGGN
jgi:hypothetical protein